MYPIYYRLPTNRQFRFVKYFLNIFTLYNALYANKLILSIAYFSLYVSKRLSPQIHSCVLPAFAFKREKQIYGYFFTKGKDVVAFIHLFSDFSFLLHKKNDLLFYSSTSVVE